MIRDGDEDSGSGRDGDGDPPEPEGTERKCFHNEIKRKITGNYLNGYEWIKPVCKIKFHNAGWR